MGELLGAALRDEQGQGSSIRVICFILLILTIAAIIGGVAFSFFKNTSGIDFMKWLIEKQFTALGGLLTVSQVKSGVVLYRKEKTNERTSVVTESVVVDQK